MKSHHSNILIFLILFLVNNMLSAQSNKEIIQKLIRMNLPDDVYVKIQGKSILTPELEVLLNEGKVFLRDTLILKNLVISIQYKKIRKLPTLKKFVSRKIWITGILKRKGKSKLLDVKYEDRLPESQFHTLENPNLKWTKGKIVKDEIIHPEWLHPFLLISTSAIVIFSFFYIRD